MKIGMIFECGPIGADKKIYEYLAKQIRPDIEICSVTLNSKPELTEECGKAAKALLEVEGCERVLNSLGYLPTLEREENASLPYRGLQSYSRISQECEIGINTSTTAVYSSRLY